MKLIDLYTNAIKTGIREDLRPKSVVRNELSKAKTNFRKLKGYEKTGFDRETLQNPYSDCRILYGAQDVDVKTVMVGIDIDVSEILLADRLRNNGNKVDLVISHHPSGRAFAQLDKVMSLQPGVWEGVGFSREVAEGLMSKRMDEVARGISSRNHNRVVDAAKILDVPLMCIHTAADNCVANYLQKIFDAKKPKKLKNVMNILMAIPEYKHSLKETGIGPSILVGDDRKDAGKIFVDMTGGTNGPDRIMSRLSQAGIKTIVGMHIKESGYKTVASEFLNYIIAGHISSDNLGMNLLFDSVDKRGELKFIECSGFKRFKRR